MDSPGVFPESPIDQDDAVHPCKGCGEILEEGKAFELAGNRWHIDCFCCNQCKKLLDSDANLLLLGDGSLICNNCTYSCSACGNKIEDLAILTGDQAFCANCFKCRNCKRRIENLRYARTSQGIFCMACHESLMARRRKKSKANRTNSSGPSAVLDKSLPALPPTMPPTAFSPTPGTDTPPELISELPGGGSPEAQTSRHKTSSLGATNRADASQVEHDERKESLTLPASTYGTKRQSVSDQQLDGAGQNGDDGFYISLALDPDPAPGPPPTAKNNAFPDIAQRSSEETQTRDYMNKGGRIPSAASNRGPMKENGQDSSRSSSTDRVRRGPASPHIAYQQKTRQPSANEHSESRSRNVTEYSPAIDRNLQSQTSSAYTSQATSPADFKLQEVPKTRKSSVSRNLPRSDPRSAGGTPNMEVDPSSGMSPTFTDEGMQQQRIMRQVERPARGSSLERPARGDSLGPGAQALQRKDNSLPGTSAANISIDTKHKRNTSSTSTTKMSADTPVSATRANNSNAPPGVVDAPNLPIRSTSRPNGGRPGAEGFAGPRVPMAPQTERHRTSESVASISSNMSAQMSPALTRGPMGDGFAGEDETVRTPRGDQPDDKESVLRRVSNAAKHMRSMSDRSGTTPKGLKTGRTPSITNGSIDISSPTTASPGMLEDGVQLRNKLRRAQQQIVELEADKRKLEDIVDNSTSMQRIETELNAKRHTISGLDTDRELIVRELEVLTDHLRKLKESNQPIDMEALKNDVIRDFSTSVMKLKDDLHKEIEELIHTRNELTMEIGEIIQMKDKGNQEYESLSNRNAQLLSVHNQLTRDIQRAFENQRGTALPSRQPPNIATPQSESRSTTSSAITSPSGLGIYAPSHSKDGSMVSSMDTTRVNSVDTNIQSLMSEDAEPAVMTAPHMINIRKGRANMWKKGSQAVAKNFKGIKGAFASNQFPDRNGVYSGQTQTITEGMPYGSMPPSDAHPIISGPMNVKRGDSMQNFWAGGQRGVSGRPPSKSSSVGMSMSNGSSNGTPNAEDALYGSELSDRVQFEGHQIPNIVARCIQEVETRGMDVEGIYRKSGGSGQVNAVKAGFEQDPHFDISDPDLDIHAVTSALKQYFRRLPTPLVSVEAYDTLLEAGDIQVRQGDTQTQDRRIQGLIAALKKLPQAHRDVLIFLNFHLQRVMQQQSSNLMTSLNLAVVFAPTIIRCADPGQELQDMQRQRQAIQALLDDHTRIADGVEEWERAGSSI